MKMKFRYLVNSAMLWTALALGSCADFLDREPYSEPVDESYWNSEEDVEAAVAGGYGLLRAALANHSLLCLWRYCRYQCIQQIRV